MPLKTFDHEIFLSYGWAGATKDFDHEIFLSYGWAGATKEDEGARRWAGELCDWLTDKLAVNSEKPRIYYDASAPRIGPIPDRLYKALEGSALLVFLVSPGSYRADSWCQREVAYFWDRARPLAKPPAVLPPEDRIVKVIQSPVQLAPEAEPLALRNLGTFNLYDTKSIGAREVAEAGNIAHPSPAVRDEMDRLFAEIRLTLEAVKDLEESLIGNPLSSRKRIFLGPTFSNGDHDHFRALRRELLLEGCEVCSATPLPVEAENQVQHRFRVGRSLERVSLAVHSVPYERLSPAWDSWQRNPAAQQIRQCLRKSSENIAFSNFIWRDPDEPVGAFEVQCLQQIGEIPSAPGDQIVKPSKGDQIVKGMSFETLTITIKSALRKAPPALPPPAAGDWFDVVIQHHDPDSKTATLIRDYIKQCHLQKAQWATPTFPKKNTKRLIERNKENFYSKGKRFLVLYGDTAGSTSIYDEWADEVCKAMQVYFKPPELGEASQWGLVLVAPPRPPDSKIGYTPVDSDRWLTKRFLDENEPMKLLDEKIPLEKSPLWPQLKQAIDEWLRQPGCPDAAREAAGS